jgi:hypothetical protein
MNPIDQDTALNNIAKIPKQTIGIIEINLGVYDFNNHRNKCQKQDYYWRYNQN